MLSKDFYLENIEKELTAGRQALAMGNDGKARVCARRAAGQAVTWYLSKHPNPKWGRDAVSQLKCLKDDPEFSLVCREAATRLTTKVSDQFIYPFATDPLEDANIVIRTIIQMMESDVA